MKQYINVIKIIIICMLTITSINASGFPPNRLDTGLTSDDDEDNTKKTTPSHIPQSPHHVAEDPVYRLESHGGIIALIQEIKTANAKDVRVSMGEAVSIQTVEDFIKSLKEVLSDITVHLDVASSVTDLSRYQTLGHVLHIKTIFYTSKSPDSIQTFWETCPHATGLNYVYESQWEKSSDNHMAEIGRLLGQSNTRLTGLSLNCGGKLSVKGATDIAIGLLRNQSLKNLAVVSDEPQLKLLLDALPNHPLEKLHIQKYNHALDKVMSASKNIKHLHVGLIDWSIDRTSFFDALQQNQTLESITIENFSKYKTDGEDTVQKNYRRLKDIIDNHTSLKTVNGEARQQIILSPPSPFSYWEILKQKIKSFSPF